MLRRLRHSAALTLLMVGLTATGGSPSIPPGRSKKAKPEQKGQRPAAAKPTPGAKPAAGAKSSSEKTTAVRAARRRRRRGQSRRAESRSADRSLLRHRAVATGLPSFPLERLTELYRRARRQPSSSWFSELSARVSKRRGGLTARWSRSAASYKKGLAGPSEPSPASSKPSARSRTTRSACLAAWRTCTPSARTSRRAARAVSSKPCRLLKDAPTREQVLRTLMGLYLDEKDFTKAQAGARGAAGGDARLLSSSWRAELPARSW